MMVLEDRQIDVTMDQLRKFMEMLCGTFDNREHCRQEEALGAPIHPHARHIIGICNRKSGKAVQNYRTQINAIMESSTKGLFSSLKRDSP